MRLYRSNVVEAYNKLRYYSNVPEVKDSLIRILIKHPKFALRSIMYYKLKKRDRGLLLRAAVKDFQNLNTLIKLPDLFDEEKIFITQKIIRSGESKLRFDLFNEIPLIDEQIKMLSNYIIEHNEYNIARYFLNRKDLKISEEIRDKLNSLLLINELSEVN